MQAKVKSRHSERKRWGALGAWLGGGGTGWTRLDWPRLAWTGVVECGSDALREAGWGPPGGIYPLARKPCRLIKYLEKKALGDLLGSGKVRGKTGAALIRCFLDVFHEIGQILRL